MLHPLSLSLFFHYTIIHPLCSSSSLIRCVVVCWYMEDVTLKALQASHFRREIMRCDRMWLFTFLSLSSQGSFCNMGSMLLNSQTLQSSMHSQSGGYSRNKNNHCHIVMSMKSASVLCAFFQNNTAFELLLCIYWCFFSPCHMESSAF